jgi:hypothetical protein
MIAEKQLVRGSEMEHGFGYPRGQKLDVGLTAQVGSQERAPLDDQLRCKFRASGTPAAPGDARQGGALR